MKLRWTWSCLQDLIFSGLACLLLDLVFLDKSNNLLIRKMATMALPNNREDKSGPRNQTGRVYVRLRVYVS